MSQHDTYFPSFVDLRCFAAEAEARLPVEVIVPEDAFLSSRYVLQQHEGSVEVGAICLPYGEGKVPDIPGDEFIIVSRGAVKLTQPGAILILTEGESAVLSRNSGFDWHCDAPTTLLYVRYRQGSADDGKLVRIDEAAPLASSGAPSPELLITTTPRCRNHTYFRSSDGKFVCGTWDSTPYHRRLMFYGHSELMHLLDGSVSIKNERGLQKTFAKGDIFLVQQGAQCGWQSQEQVKKVYAIYHPA